MLFLVNLYLQLFLVIKCVNTITVSLNGNDWFASNQNKSIQVLAEVPGSIYTDLLKNNVLEQDPYFGSNDLNYRWVSLDNWTYYKMFSADEEIIGKKAIFLVCHGLDTIAKIYVNTILIGSTDNMFVRYKFDIKPHLKKGFNKIVISFESAVNYVKRVRNQFVESNYVVPPESLPLVQRGENHVNFIRKMQSSFSWDWGPGFATLGIWKNIEIEAYDSLVIRDITVTPIPLINDKWDLNITLYLESTHRTPFECLLQISIYNIIIYRNLVEFKPSFDGSIEYNMKISVNDSIVIHKWFPNGMGSQMLYDLNFFLTTTEEDLRKTLRIGFRSFELIEDPIEPKGRTFYFKINGIPFYSKGSNWIPAHVFQEQLTSDYIRHLLKSCREANMNMLRVWGGGLYESDLFYQIADEMGILIWQDFMFACALYPTNQQFLNSVKEEVKQQIRRLSYHPSIVIWAGNNENEAAIAQVWWPEIYDNEYNYKKDYIRLYIKTIREEVLKNDNSRPYLSSSPSNGRQTIREGWLSNYPQDNNFGDTHFYYYGQNTWDWKTYPSTRFASEYGFQSYPSLNSLSKVVNSSDLKYPLSNAISERQHHRNGNTQIMSLIENYLKLPVSGGIDRLDDFIYLSQISQAMALKTETEFYRRNRAVNPENGEGFTMGALYWQLNDIWPAPTWSSIEFGGQWKMAHYFIKHIFEPLLVVVFEDNNQIKVSLIRDDYKGILDFEVKVNVWKWTSIEPTFQLNKIINSSSISSKIVFEEMTSNLLNSGECFNRNECFIEVMAYNQLNNWRTNNFLFMSPLRNAIGLNKSNVSVIEMRGPLNFTPDYIYEIIIKSDSIALFVWLDFTLDSQIRAQFSDNGFLMSSKTKSLQFYSKTPFEVNYLRTHLTIKSLTDVKTES